MPASAPSPGRLFTTLGIAFTAVLALVTAGCQNTPSARIKANPEVFQSLDEFSQRLIREGLVNVGFTSDLVYLALGKPNRVAVVATVNGSVEIWRYRNFLYGKLNAPKLTVSNLGSLVNSSGGTAGPSSGEAQLQLALTDSDLPIGTLVLELFEQIVISIRIER